MPKRPRLPLTVRSIDSVKPEPGKTLKVAFRKPKGLVLIVYPSGRKTFAVRYGKGAQRTLMLLGDYGPLTAEEAKSEAHRILGRVAEGRDPAEEKAHERTIPTFGEWAAGYLDLVKAAKPLKSWKMDKAYLEEACKRWSPTRVDKITAEDVERLRGQVAKRGRITANRWLASVRACFTAAWRASKVTENPAMKVKPLRENNARTRVLSMDELERVLDAVAALEDPHARLALAILIDTGARLSEVLRAKWEDFNLETGRWSLVTTKAGRPTTKTLPAATLAALNNTPRLGPFVIAGRPTGRKRTGQQEPPAKPRADLTKPWRAVCEAAGLKEVHIHDLRRTFGLEVFRKFGVGAAAKALGHSSPQVTAKVYSPFQPADERRIVETVAGDRAKVIRINRKKREAGGEGA